VEQEEKELEIEQRWRLAQMKRERDFQQDLLSGSTGSSNAYTLLVAYRGAGLHPIGLFHSHQ
jgi:hypothetical protein